MITEQAFGRAHATLVGLALGDALGMPTQSMPPSDIAAAYGGISGLTTASPSQPIAPSMPAGSITDDTEQALLVADLLIEGNGTLIPERFARALLDWEDDMISRGSLDLLGPSTKSALEAIRNGADPGTTGRTGTTNGAAMRIAPVGIASDVLDSRRFADAVYESCRVTHDTAHGFTSAGVVAAAISLGINGATTREAIRDSLDFVADLPPRGAWSPKANVLSRAVFAIRLSDDVQCDEDFVRQLRSEVGTSVESNESIPCALALAHRYAEEPRNALIAAANLGGDTDTIGAISGAILGATNGSEVWPAEWWSCVQKVSNISLNTRVAALLDIRKNVQF